MSALKYLLISLLHEGDAAVVGYLHGAGKVILRLAWNRANEGHPEIARLSHWDLFTMRIHILHAS